MQLLLPQSRAELQSLLGKTSCCCKDLTGRTPVSWLARVSRDVCCDCGPPISSQCSMAMPRGPSSSCLLLLPCARLGQRTIAIQQQGAAASSSSCSTTASNNSSTLSSSTTITTTTTSSRGYSSFSMSSSRRALGTASASSVARSAGSYTLPKPSWSLADLKLARRGADDGSAARTTTLSREEVGAAGVVVVRLLSIFS